MAALTLSGRQLIGGELCAEGNVVFRAIDPQSGEHLAPPFHQASNAEVAQAAELAEAAFDPFRNISIDQRADFLDAIGEELTAIGPQLIARAGEETALPEMRLQGELVRTVNQLKLFARVLRDGSYQDARIDCAQPQRQPLPKADVRSMLIPLGPVAIFGASNFPLAFSVAGGDTAAALAAGCPVVFKGHPLHPGTCELAAQSISSAAVRNGLPPGVFALLQSDSNHTGAALVQQPQIKALAFTGSLAGGRALFDLACARSEPIPVFAEMGSINPLVCLPQAVAERTESLAQGLADSITLGVGQQPPAADR
ncbi:MAG: aldehyde dehydrogenase family protein, partial [Desulfuromonadales bacterium]|nr:aldehyde dehydrogenase family protein [Desulfuromonadales bacterium]